MRRTTQGLREDRTLYLLVKAQPGVDIEQLRQRLESRLRDVSVRTNREFSRMTRTYWMFTTGASIAVLLAALLGLVGGVVIVTQTIYATTVDHIREYGRLKAMGATNRYLCAVIIQQAVISALVGYTLGMVASVFVLSGSSRGGSNILCPAGWSSQCSGSRWRCASLRPSCP